MPLSKNGQFSFRVEAELRSAFTASCDANHIPAAQVLRQFMRDYVRANPSDEQPPTIRRVIPKRKGGSDDQ